MVSIFRAYNYLWHCVKANLNNGYCKDEVIDAHLTFSLMEATNNPWDQWNCPSKCFAHFVEIPTGEIITFPWNIRV